MLSQLPDFADPVRLCALGKVYKGSVALAEMTRLAGLLASDDGAAQFVLTFSRDDEMRSTVQVNVVARLPVQCQRCLGTMTIDVDSSSRLAVVFGPDEAERLPDELDPLLVDQAPLALRSLVEDELILAVPTAAMHPPEACSASAAQMSDAATVQRPGADDNGDEHPFAALAGLKPRPEPDET